MNTDVVPSAAEIDKTARNILIQSKAWGVFPTPVDQIVSYVELGIERGVDLSRAEYDFFSRFSFVPKFAKKVLGILDYRQKVIYLDHTQPVAKNRFIKLHEVTHNSLTWQKEAYGFVDDEKTLDPDVKAEFEREANYGASALLFQLDVFDEEAEKLPLTIRAVQALAQKFGASVHATLRRYVQKSKKRCAVLVLNPPEESGTYGVSVRDYFQSVPFTAQFGELIWPEKCGWEFPFTSEIRYGRKFSDRGQLTVLTNHGSLNLTYHFFNNSFNSFVLVFPIGETNKSRTVIVSKN